MAHFGGWLAGSPARQKNKQSPDISVFFNLFSGKKNCEA